MRSWTSESEADTRSIGALLGKELRPQGLLLLQGDLGAGKTVLVQGMAEALGIDPTQVQSPTFMLVQEFRGDQDLLVHLDLYRLQAQEAEALGVDEILVGEGVKVVEWAERLNWAPERALRVKLERTAKGRLIREVEAFS